MITVLIHILNEETILGEIDDMPNPNDTILLVKNPRRKDGKDLPYLSEGVDKVFWPMNRLAYVEIAPSKEEEHIIGFVRD
ncbi:MAG: hypothetical protein WHV44_00465 [Anaerolineales bacterium]